LHHKVGQSLDGEGHLGNAGGLQFPDG
jgi:hypothetical protein